MASLSTASWTTAAAGLVILYALYRALLPKPLPDIPYNHDAANKLFGDVPEMMAYVMRTKRIFCWLTSLTARHDSPIVQAFIKPMSRPWVIVTDPFESQDILLRRTREFDRSSMFGDYINGILPEQHIQFLSTDDRFKKNRALINHLMAPTFINQVSAPETFKAAMTMIKVWEHKCDAAKGRPFAAHHDITSLALDSVFASFFGLAEQDSITVQTLKTVTECLVELDGADIDEPVVFPSGKVPEVPSAVLTLGNTVTDTQLSPVPRLTSWVIRKFPSIKKATAIKDQYLFDKIDECVKLIDSGIDSDKPRSALHSVLLREQETAQSEGRPPAYRGRGIRDEFFGFMLAGHDTSATTVAWGIKLLTDNAAAQGRLRADLREALLEATRERRAPTYAELCRTHVPFLDATVEEVLRHANTIPYVARMAMQDTTILGRRIPKGTDVFLMANGAGYLEPSMPLADQERSPGARRAGVKAGTRLTGAWDDADVGDFRPERWLKEGSASGDEEFDSMAGPNLAFGLGPRGCYGRRLALQQLKIQFALIVWHFNLLKCPEDLSGYEAIQRFAREPTQCFVRLSRAS